MNRVKHVFAIFMSIRWKHIAGPIH